MEFRFLSIIVFLVILPFLAEAQIVLAATDIKCYGDKNGKVTVTSVGSASNPIKNYSWSNGQSGKSMTSQSDLKAGTYMVTVTDANDCTGTAQAIVKGPASPLRLDISTAAGEFFVCGPGTILVTAAASGGSAPVSVNGGGSSITLEVGIGSFGGGPKVLTFVATDKNGCQVKRKQGFAFSGFSCASDPNDIIGPPGILDPRWVAAKNDMPYTVRFENDPELATASAQIVHVYVPVPEHINPFTLRLGDFGWGPYSFDVPDQATYYQKRLDLTTELNLYVDVVAGLDVVENRFFWIFTSIDPQTNQRPVDPQAGFLPVNDTLTGIGEGFLTFSMRPALSTTTLDSVIAKAEIIFDINESILTNTWINTLDAIAPVSTILPIPDTIEGGKVTIHFSGNDDINGTGIQSYALYSAQYQGEFELVASDIDTSVYTFKGTPGTNYRFFSRATDQVGNQEALKTIGEDSVFLLPIRSITIDTPDIQQYCVNDSFLIAWTKVLVDSVKIEMTLDSGLNYTILEASTINDRMTIFLYDTMLCQYAAIRITDLAVDSVVTQSSYFSINPIPVIEAGPDQDLCLGSNLFLLATGGNAYTWSPDTSLNNATLTNPRSNATVNTQYFVTGVSAVGCSNIDSVWVLVHPLSLDTIVHLMCNQDSVYAGGAYQTEPGFYTDELSSSFGCDSTVVTKVILTGPCDFPSPQVYVDEDATGLNNGTSWANAFVELSDALVASREWANAQEIWVAEGNYSPHPTMRDSSFNLRDSIKIYGGFLGFETDRSERTADPELVFLSGDINIQDTLWDNSYHTVIFDSSCKECTLDGVTIHYGYADQIGNDTGAGLLNSGKGQIYNVIFERNFATELGAAVYSSGTSANLTFQSCTFRLNASSLGRDVVNLNGGVINFAGVNSLKE